MTNDNTRDNSSRLLTKVFHTRDSAEKAYNALIRRGYSKSDISILMSDQTRDKYFADTDLPESDLGNKALEGLGVGSAIGGALGAFAAGIATIGTIVTIPGLGLIIAGPLAAGLAGAGAGSIAGGLAGTLIGSGVPGDRAQEYEEAIKSGDIVIGIHTHSNDDYLALESEWERINS